MVRSIFSEEASIEENNEENEDENLDTSDPVLLSLPDDNLWDVFITFIDGSTNSVIIRFVGEAYSDQLDLFETLLEQEFKKDKSEPITEGMLCVANIDGLFHRVRLVAIEDRKVNCFFLDHGDTDNVTPEQLRPLDPTVNKRLPYQAVKVSLHGLEGVAENMTALSKLCDLALGKTCIADPINWDDSLSVVLYVTTGDADININEEIIRAIETARADVTTDIGNLSLADADTKLTTKILVNGQRDSLSEENVSKELKSEMQRDGFNLMDNIGQLSLSEQQYCVEKDSYRISNSVEPSLYNAENVFENSLPSITNSDSDKHFTLPEMEEIREEEEAVILGHTILIKFI